MHVYTRRRHETWNAFVEPANIVIHFRVDLLLTEAGGTERPPDLTKSEGIKHEIPAAECKEVRLLARVVNGHLKHAQVSFCELEPACVLS